MVPSADEPASTKRARRTPEHIAQLVEDDVTASLGRYFPPQPSEDGSEDDWLPAYARLPVFDDIANDVTASKERGAGAPEYHLVRWRYHGYHDPDRSLRWPDPSDPPSNGPPRGSYPTGNRIAVDGLTVVEQDSANRCRMRQYVDWLSVYAQLGMVFEGRPIGLSTTPDPPPSTESGT